MLRALDVKSPHVPAGENIPPVARALVGALANGEDLTTALASQVRGLGFDSFLYGVLTSPSPTRESRTYYWTNLPEEWVREYDERAFIEIDPRIHAGRGSLVPVLWDRSTFPDTEQHRLFFDAAARYGIRSGVTTVIRNAYHAPAGLILNSSKAPVDEHRRRQIAERFGEIISLASCLHELFLAHVVAKFIPPSTEGRPLSARERQCLQHVARGCTSRQAGEALGISERTVDQHIANALAKLGAANRQEAVARATTLGLVER